MNCDPEQLRLRATRNAEPARDKLTGWLPGIEQAEHRTSTNGEPSPYEMALLDGFTGLSAERVNGAEPMPTQPTPGRVQQLTYSDGGAKFAPPIDAHGRHSTRDDGAGNFPAPSPDTAPTEILAGLASRLDPIERPVTAQHVRSQRRNR